MTLWKFFAAQKSGEPFYRQDYTKSFYYCPSVSEQVVDYTTKYYWRQNQGEDYDVFSRVLKSGVSKKSNLATNYMATIGVGYFIPK